METLITTVANNIGQVDVLDAETEIKQLNQQEQDPFMIWERDFSPQMFVIDEADNDVSNPNNLKKGYCWIVKRKIIK